MNDQDKDEHQQLLLSLEDAAIAHVHARAQGDGEELRITRERLDQACISITFHLAHSALRSDP